MQKINRERTLSALKTLPHERTDAEDRLIENAASKFLELTDPKYEVPSHVYEAVDPFDQVKYMFKEMLQEYVE